MAAPNASTFDLDPPRRPGIDDFNGIAKEDDPEEPPNPREQPNAAEWNTMEWLLMSIGRVMPVSVVSVASNAVTQASAAKKDVTTGTFTVTVNGTGDLDITWPANTFPAAVAAPAGFLNSGPGMIHVSGIVNGVNVKTYDGTGVAANRDFTVHIY